MPHSVCVSTASHLIGARGTSRPAQEIHPLFLRIEHSFETADFPPKLNFPLSISKWDPPNGFQDEQVRMTPPASRHIDAVCVLFEYMFELCDHLVVSDDDV